RFTLIHADLSSSTAIDALEAYTPSLHDALPISGRQEPDEPLPEKSFVDREHPQGNRRANHHSRKGLHFDRPAPFERMQTDPSLRSEEHTSELQSPDHLSSRLPLAKKTSRTRRRP